jgi:hypothetical protein
MSTKNNVSSDILDSPMYQLYLTSDGEPFASCSGGTQPCAGAQLAVVAEESSVHDKTLVRLTRKINQLLAEASKKQKDRDLELIHVGDQVLLAWTSPDKPPAGAKAIHGAYEIKQLLTVRPRNNPHGSDQ